ncbi:hypothetical protein Sros01_29480 [Streptomyces roseochromogenus]|nr:hypothetical protein Sros01_29480 [Streptomyces roseochromogenus]
MGDAGHDQGSGTGAQVCAVRGSRDQVCAFDTALLQQERGLDDTGVRSGRRRPGSRRGRPSRSPSSAPTRSRASGRNGGGDGVAILQRSDAGQVRERGFGAEGGLGLLVAAFVLAGSPPPMAGNRYSRSADAPPVQRPQWRIQDGENAPNQAQAVKALPGHRLDNLREGT